MQHSIGVQQFDISFEDYNHVQTLFLRLVVLSSCRPSRPLGDVHEDDVGASQYQQAGEWELNARKRSAKHDLDSHSDGIMEGDDRKE